MSDESAKELEVVEELEMVESKSELWKFGIPQLQHIHGVLGMAAWR